MRVGTDTFATSTMSEEGVPRALPRVPPAPCLGLLVNELAYQLAAILSVVHKAFTPASQKKTVFDAGLMSVMGIYRQLSCCGDENHAYGRMTLGVFPPDPKFRGYHAHQGRDASV